MKDIKIYKEMLEVLFEGIYFVDNNRLISFWNKGAEKITGFTAEEVVGKHCSDNILNHVDANGNKLCLGACPLQATLDDGEIRETFVYLQHKKGHRISVMVKTIPLFEDGKVVGSVEVFVDDRERVKLKYDIEQLKELAIRDQLTSLPNRRYIESYLHSRISDSRKFEIPFGIVFMDIDHFKNVNDTYGHNIGDEVLKMISETFKSCVRKNDIVGRWGGEEFIGVFTGITINELSKISENIRMLIENSRLTFDGGELSVTISIGSTMFSGEELMDEMIRRADENMYTAKNTGRNKVVVL